MKLIHSAMAALTFMTALSVTADSGAAQKVVRVAVYRGPASCKGCSETAKSSIEKIGSRYRVDYIGPHERQDITESNLKRYDLYVQPGGGQDIPAAFASIGAARASAIRQFVQRGGNYLGLCMGAYLADDASIGLIEGRVESEVNRPGFPVDTIEDTAVNVTWLGHRDSVFFQDGSYFQPPEDGRSFKRLATYQNGDVAAARYVVGKGIVILSGPHPEADQSWFEEAEIPLEKMPKRNLLKDLLDQF